MKAALIFALCGCVSLAEGPALGDDEPDVDCNNAMTQFDMNVCSARDYEAADAELNAQWTITKKAMAEVDRDIDDVDQRGAEKSLLSAQRAWITYRDGQCEAQGYRYYGGSIRPLIVSSCLADLTRNRTEELKALIEEY